MLKKILSIFFILCLVFSLTVPCFAQDPNYFTAPSVYGFVDYSMYITDVYIYNDNNTFYFQGESSTSGGRLSFSRFFSNPLGTFTEGHTYYFYYQTSSPFTLYVSNSDNSLRLTISGSRYYTPPSTIQLFLGWNFQPNTSYDISATVLVLDVTDYLERYPTVSDLESYLESINFDFNNTFPQVTYFNQSYMNPFVDFNKFVFETFTFDTMDYLTPLAFIGGILALLVFIFLVVFMIKRFTGGKT